MTTEYHKIQSVFLRDPATNHKTFLEGQYTIPAFAYLAQNKWVWTEKVDGTNIRVQFDGQKVTFGGRTDAAQIQANLWTALVEMFTPEAMATVFVPEAEPLSVVLYGEGYGANIQKGGGNYTKTPSFVLFDVRVGCIWLERESVVNIAEKLNLRVVPIIGTGTLPEAVEFVRAGIVSAWGPFAAEGIVARPECELKDRRGSRVITKIKTKDFAAL